MSAARLKNGSIYQRILLAVDGSAQSLVAVASVVALVLAFRAELLLLTLWDPCPPRPQGRAPEPVEPVDVSAAIRHAWDVIHKVEPMVQAQAITPRTSVMRSPIVWRGILDGATSMGADLFVMAARGQTGMQHWVLGNAAQQVLQHAQVPVLLVQYDSLAAHTPMPGRDLWRGLQARSERMVHGQLHS